MSVDAIAAPPSPRGQVGQHGREHLTAGVRATWAFRPIRQRTNRGGFTHRFSQTSYWPGHLTGALPPAARTASNLLRRMRAQSVTRARASAVFSTELVQRKVPELRASRPSTTRAKSWLVSESRSSAYSTALPALVV